MDPTKRSFRLLLGVYVALATLASDASAQVFVREVARGFPSGLAVRNAGGDDTRVFVVSQNGFIRIREAGAAAPLAAPFLNLSATGTSPPGGFSCCGERGLLGLAFHPQYASNGLFYVYYTDTNTDIRIARYSRSAGDANLANPNSGLSILRVNQVQGQDNHNGGDLNFGSDGFLYLAPGDGGGAGDPCERSQTLNPATLNNFNNCAATAAFTSSGGNPNARALSGKMIRIDIDNTTAATPSSTLCSSNADGSANYSIPPSNPFAGADAAAGCDETYHYGLRNPFRFSFDRLTGDMFIGDVGQSVQEEISFAANGISGLNFGWDTCEGTANFEGSCSTPGFTAPILFYTRPANPAACSVTGGFRYRGQAVPALSGRYVYADYCSGQLWVAIEGAGGVWTSTSLPPQPGFSTAGFGEDSSGELYIADLSGMGRLFRFVGEDIFANGFE